MTPTNTREYYAKVRSPFGSYSWSDQLEAKTLTAAQSFLSRNWKDVMEIGVSVNGAMIKVVAIKAAEGKWEVAK